MSIPLLDVKQAKVVPINDEGIVGTAIIGTKDNKNWQLWNNDGSVRNGFPIDIDVSGNITVVIENGDITAHSIE